MDAVLVDREWLVAGRFTVADLLMADVMRQVDRFDGCPITRPVATSSPVPRRDRRLKRRIVTRWLTSPPPMWPENAPCTPRTFPPGPSSITEPRPISSSAT
ncbi:glutathione binding-like protein [Sphingobium sp. LMC3-1-1.1]|uniref:glutathione binding-like protein n=1 Tax=Sphingobium sp. LMC3-1-1.1 TaxID=3135241 RepID=UPI003429CB68